MSSRGVTYIGPPSADDRAAEGRALRDEIPRESHGHWNPDPGRPHPIELIQGHVAGEVDLASARYNDMFSCSLAFFERTVALMAYDLLPSPVTGITVQLCGDCHAANYGLYRSADRTLHFDLRDFD